jgi:hypothetical protein
MNCISKADLTATLNRAKYNFANFLKKRPSLMDCTELNNKYLIFIYKHFSIWWILNEIEGKLISELCSVISLLRLTLQQKMCQQWMNTTFDGVYKIAKNVCGKSKCFMVILFYIFIPSVTPKFFQCNEPLKYREIPIFRVEIQNSWSSTFRVSTFLY